MKVIHKKYMAIVFLNLISGCSSTEMSSFLDGAMDVVKANPQILYGDLESPIIYPEYEEIENTDASSSESNDENIDENNDGVVDENSLTNNSSEVIDEEVIDEEVQRYLNDPSSPIVDRERLVKYLHELNGARLEISYHPNGMVSSKDYYKDDKFELYKIYDDSGKLVTILVYDIREFRQ
ncbi:MAG TPA: hypothetical protein DCF97_08575 [Plesiomonas shigelloides]|nr:hypothetical protein [Plesiomonas shigelloides]